MPDNATQDYIKSRRDAIQSREDAVKKAYSDFKQSKKEAEILQKKAKQEAADKEAKKLSETTYKATVKQLENLRDSIVSEAMAVCNTIWDQTEEQYKASTGKQMRWVIF